MLMSVASSWADQVFVATSSAEFFKYDTLTGAFSTPHNNGTVLYGLGFTTGGVLYANDSSANPNNGLYTVNTSTGALTFVGDIGLSSGGPGTLSAAANGGQLYLADRGNNNLYTINPSNGAATLIGNTGVAIGGSWDLNFGPDGNLYLSSSGNLYKINQSTGANTFVGSFGSGLQMQSIVEGDGNLYGFDFSGMYTINLLNGTATFDRNTPAGLGDFYAETPVFAGTAVPEPRRAYLLVFVLIATLMVRSRRAIG